jgi:3-hydroxyacyl-CoA dehydrogenase
MRCVAVIGTGVIGASLAAWFLARGLDVRASDPAPGAEAALRAAVAAHWPTLTTLGLSPDASPGRLQFLPSVEAAVDGAAFVQENGPERLDLKRELFRRLDAAAAPGIPLASSSSSLMVSEFQDLCAEPGRVLLGHPFNPPHLIPLVEVVGGERTAEAALEQAMRFYSGIGKHPIRLHKERRGHVANRLQAALWQEAIHLVAEGVVSVADLDAAVAHGPGLRWALLGPFFNLHLSGGAGGMRHTLDHLGPPVESMWRDLGAIGLTQATKDLVVRGTDALLAGLDQAEVVRRRDAVLVRLLAMKSAENLP